MSEEVLAAAAWLADGHRVALGTVIKTWGSAPRQAGSQIAVRDDGVFSGSVSGGCVEGAVIEAALETIADGKNRRLEFGVSDNQAWDVGLACGGRIEILVGQIGNEVLAALARGADRPLVRAVARDRAANSSLIRLRITRRWAGRRRRLPVPTKAAKSTWMAKAGSWKSTIRRWSWSWSGRCISPRPWRAWRFWPAIGCA